MLTTWRAERTRPPVANKQCASNLSSLIRVIITPRWPCGHQHDNATCRGHISAIDYYHRECGTNLFWSIIAGVESSKQTDLCRALSEGASWLGGLCVHMCVYLHERVSWKALQVKCCANSVQVGLMSSPRVLFCWQADW